ncbi:MAG: methyltransferase domain-containing protein [Clostridiales bacterium]|nr:methyltransferase domain-containing protein [Clostridiales bacterium]
MLQEGERLEDLQYKGLKIIQNKNLYNFTGDSVVLANFVKGKNLAIEIGAGSGVISILVAAKTNIEKILAFEIQPEMQNLCKKNIELNSLQEKITLVSDDVKNFEKYISAGSVDVVFSNPPYFKETNFVQSKVKKIAKEEVCLPLEILTKVASKMLKVGGSFYCCYTAERICEMISSCKKNKLTIKELFFTENGKGEVKLALFKAVKGGKEGVKIYPNLVTNEENGNYLETLHTKYIGAK